MDIRFEARSYVAGASAGVAVIVTEPVDAAALASWDAATDGALSRALSGSRFKGSAGQSLDLVAPHGLAVARLTLIGAGKELTALSVEATAAAAYGAVKNSGVAELALVLPGDDAGLAAAAAQGVRLAAYRFDRYKTTEKPEAKPSVQTLTLVSGDPDGARAAHAANAGLADAIIFARDLVWEPANVLHPEEFARRVKSFTDLGVSVEILGEKEMAALGMGALLGVGQGSVRESQLAILQWKGAADPNAQPIAFVGKGVCFDTGGISLKPADGMEEMITDMGGAAAVAGAIRALAARKAKVNAVGILGLVENMPDGAAQRPGDIVKSMSGQTIEIINTDAEGRLVLADALWYCQHRFKPKAMIDLATLTGAIIISLGKDIAGMFPNNDELADKLMAASKASGEQLWRMPMPDAYEKQIESATADMKNTGGRPGGSITAALFLKKFVNGVPWAHLDIASTAFKPGSTVPTIPSGATGFGVRLLDRLVADHYEG
jgi:leucyl aminopeptidase